MFLLAWLVAAPAAELGDASVRSHIGQPLVADVELTALADENAPVQVALASADVYRGANIRMHPALADLNISINRRGGHRTIHLLSSRPIDAEYLHLFLDVTEGNRRNVRAVTLWLTPAPPPEPAPAPVPVPPAPVALPAPSAPVAAVPVPVATPAPAPLPRAVRMSTPAPACPSPSAEQLRACTALDYKNATLRAQIVDLEEKVKLLQMAIEGKTSRPAPRAVVHAAAPRVITPKEESPPAAKHEAGTPWLFIGIASAAIAGLIGALGFVLWRRRKLAAKPVMPAGPGVVAAWKERALRILKLGKAPTVGVVTPDE
ncbi:MAG: hypothetical protein ABIT83_05380 [Massilia sp.]